MSFQPPPHLSPSSLGTYNQCQLKFKYSKIDGRQEDPTEETLLGNFVHDVLENLYGLEPEHRTLKNAQSIAGELWQNGWGDRATPWILKKHYGSQDAVRGFRWKAFWCIENLWKIENPTSLSPSGLEHELNGTIGGVTIKGFIDRYSPLDDGGFVISDYKTGKTPKPNWVGDKFTQLLIYSHLLLSTGVGEAKEVELLYLKDGVKFNEKVTEELLSATESYVVETKEKIDESCVSMRFTTSKSILCNWCSFRKECPAWR